MQLLWYDDTLGLYGDGFRCICKSVSFTWNQDYGSRIGSSPPACSDPANDNNNCRLMWAWFVFSSVHTNTNFLVQFIFSTMFFQCLFTFCFIHFFHVIFLFFPPFFLCISVAALQHHSQAWQTYYSLFCVCVDIGFRLWERSATFSSNTEN